MNLAKLERKLGNRELPEELIKLCKFEEYCQNDARVNYTDSLISESFFIDLNDLSFFEEGLSTWCEDPRFIKSFLIFASATASGSNYAFWDDGSGKPLSEMPIVVVGDEGDLAIVADDMKDLMRLLTIDSEVLLTNNYASFSFPEEFDEVSDYHQEYLEWLRKTFRLEPVSGEEEAKSIIDKAVEKHSENFKKWLTPLIDYEYVIERE